MKTEKASSLNLKAGTDILQFVCFDVIKNKITVQLLAYVLFIIDIIYIHITVYIMQFQICSPLLLKHWETLL
jgi:hypothetical protein